MAQQGMKKPTGLNEENKDINKGSFDKQVNTELDKERSYEKSGRGQDDAKETKGFRVVKEEDSKNQSQGGAAPDGQGITAGRLGAQHSESDDLEESKSAELGDDQPVGANRRLNKNDESEGLPNQNP